MNAMVKTDSKLIATITGTSMAAEEKQYFTFMLGGEMFSLGILCIKEIIWYANLTEVPVMPACIRGVINLRGAAVPVLVIPTAKIEPAPTFGAKIRSEFIEGIAKVAGKFVILLNVAKVLSMQEISQLGQVTAMADGIGN